MSGRSAAAFKGGQPGKVSSRLFLPPLLVRLGGGIGRLGRLGLRLLIGFISPDLYLDLRKTCWLDAILPSTVCETRSRDHPEIFSNPCHMS